MRILWGLTLAVGYLAASEAAAQTASQFRGVPNAAALSKYGLEIAWTGQAVLNPSRDRLDHFVMDEEVVFVQGTNGVVSAFDGETGRRIWAVRLGSFDEPSFPAVTNEDIVLVVVGPAMFGLNKLSGDVIWEIRLPGPPSTGPSIDDSQVYVGTLDGSVYAYSLRKIRNLYLERRLPEWSHEAVVWRYQAALEITSPPVPIEGAVNFASRDGSLYSVSKERRKLNYQFETDAAIVAPMALVGQSLFMASEDYTFYAVNSANGVVLWEFVTGLPIRQGPVALGSSLYLHPYRGGLYALDVTSGDQKWWQPKLTSFVSLVGSTVVARDLDKNLVLVDQDSGRMVGRIPASYYDHHVANDRSDRIYLANSRGQVLAIRESGRNYPLYHRYPER
ncbi:MAG: pyrrolo-quinoline quinone, partial [Planctomycetales bacterium 12-60-4]